MVIRIRDEHVRGTLPLLSPKQLFAELPVDVDVAAHIARTRQTIRGLLQDRDDRALVVVGPCSIDDPEAALEYARRLRAVAAEVEDVCFVVMRVYFEKPRTTIGWKGLINDPHLDDSGDLNTGIRTARKLLIDVANLGMPAATEFLEPVVPQYIAELVTWAAIGARTTESPTHRQLASGLSMPVGFKNGTDGGFQIALDALVASAHPHHFLGIDHDGRVAIIETTGNPDRHLILRGGAEPNFDVSSLAEAVEALASRGLNSQVLVDCAHGNSEKDAVRQRDICSELAARRANGEPSILGWMVESYLEEGRQNLPEHPEARIRGLSLTDPCLGWSDTEAMLRESAELLRAARATTKR